jgi:hypothetical protein
MGNSKNTEKQRYVVAPGVSFVGNKRAYVAGDPIDESAFIDPKHFKILLSGKSPKIIPAPPETEKEPEKKSDRENENGTGLDRKTLEEKALASGLVKTADELAAFKDSELAELLKNSGIE